MDRMLIRGGLVYDGADAPPRRADVMVAGGLIEAVAPGLPAQGADVVEAAGRMVTPGFVDIHRHCDITPITQPDFGRLELAQGITTTLAGNCGLAPVPLCGPGGAEMAEFLSPITGPVPEGCRFADYDAYTAAVERAGLPLNMGFLAGAGSIKVTAKGYGKGPYTEAELEAAAALVADAVRAGAFGASLGIMYYPEYYSTAAEMARVVRPIAGTDGLLSTHVRGEGDSLVESVQEVIGVAAEAGVRLNVSHFKATGIHNWRDIIFRAIEAIDDARARGQAVTADFYPYDGGSTSLMSLVPPTVLEDSTEATLAKMGTPAGREALREAIYRQYVGWDNMATSIGWERVLVSSVTLPEHAAMPGHSLQALADAGGYADPALLVADLLASEQGRVGVIVLSMAQADIDDIARLPYTALISDSLYGGGENAHPRLYGAFPKFLREYVRDRGVLPMERAIHKMTGMPAERMGLRDRGFLREGYVADLLVFDPMRFTDNAGYSGVRRPATGIDLVLLAGRPVWREEAMLPVRHGSLLRKGVNG